MFKEIEEKGLYEPKMEHDACGVGAVANISGEKTHKIVQYGKEILMNLDHRGAASADNITGDGAGILFQIPHEFFKSEAKTLGFKLPDTGNYGVGFVFGSKDKKIRETSEKILEKAIAKHGLEVLGWREVPVDASCLGEMALAAEPVIKQIFVAGKKLKNIDLERTLYLARKTAEHAVLAEFGEKGEDFYLTSMSSRTIVYKGMFMANQLFAYFPDLSNEKVVSALCVVHQRYSTNTMPNWRLAQPFRYVAHNGEINTLSGNRNHMKIRENTVESSVFGENLSDILPVLDDSSSDSASFDQMLEFLELNGRTIPHSMMMMMPEAFGQKYHISNYKKAFYEYHASIMEPWDGPAAMVFSDGNILGGTLDRNGLRPARYLVTTDGLVVLGSETGVIEFPPEHVAKKGRLKPGKMFIVDTTKQRILRDHEIKGRISRYSPYRRWLEDNKIELRGLFGASKELPMDHDTYEKRLKIFGFNEEELGTILLPMVLNGQEPIGAMGNDTLFAVLSDKPRSIYEYFKQMFAQVTNPPIDPLREALVMSLMSYTGKKRNLLEESPEHCKQLKLPHPILTNDDIIHLKEVENDDFKVATISSIFNTTTGDDTKALQDGLELMVKKAEEAIDNDASLIILSDRAVSPTMAPIPSLIATSYLNNILIEKSKRGSAGIIVESGDAREIMHFCLLIGFGANAINPYMAFETFTQLQMQNDIPQDMRPSKIIDNYIGAIKKGILKTMSKMGISTLRSYHTAQLFEAFGLNKEFVNKYFTGVTSRIGGIGLEQIAMDSITRHKSAYTKVKPGERELEFGGNYSFRKNGEDHKWNPTTIAKLQHAVMHNNESAYEEFAEAANNETKAFNTLRGLFEFKKGNSIPLDEVESADEIVKRFCSGAMSHGSISQEAHECMAIAMNRLGGMSNTGEGGEDPSRYTPEANGDSKNSAIKQVASGRFGVTIDYLAHAKEIQIKMAQGAKPGEGGQLPGHKVSEDIARLRYATPGVSLISPPPHHDIYSIEDLAQLIFDLKCANPGGKVSVKLVSEVGVGTIAAGVAKGNADEVLISSHDGGTGASPLTSLMHVGGPWELGIAEAQQVMVANKLRDRTRLQVDGGMKTGRDVVIGAMLGADQFGFGTPVLVSMGCSLLRKCHTGTCSYGIATQIPELRNKFKGNPDHIVKYFRFMAEEIRKIMAELGFKKFHDIIGRTDFLEMRSAIDHYKAKGLDFSAMFHRVIPPDGTGTRLLTTQPDKLADHIDWSIIEKAKDAIENKTKVEIDVPVRNVNRTIGPILSNKIVLKHGPEGLPDETLQINMKGSAGQSFGAFLAPGVTLKLVGDSNDYVGKGLSGGRIVIKTPEESKYIAHENIIAGNTLLYGATMGEAFINGVVGERFCVRNSGVTAVVEGVGDHGCEYMTGGVAVVLGKTGVNFAAGMSGGIAYVFDEMELFDTVCNLDMVDLENVWRKEDNFFGNIVFKERVICISCYTFELICQ